MIVEYARSFFPVILIVLLFRSFIAEPFKIPSGSMMPTLLVGDFILVNKFAYGLRLPVLNTKIFDVGEPQRGDVFVFRYPGFTCMRDGKEIRSGKPCDYPLAPVPKLDYIKRVIGLPGDEITYRNKIAVRERQGNSADLYRPVCRQRRRRPAHGRRRGQARNAAGRRTSDAGLAACMPGPRARFGFPLDTISRWGIIGIIARTAVIGVSSRKHNLVGKAFVIWMNWDGGIDFKRIGTLIK